MDIKRKWDLSSDEAKKKCMDEIIRWFDDIQGDSVGVIAAQDLLDTLAQTIGPDLYNKGVTDAKQLLAGRFEDIQIDLDILKQ